MQTSASVFRQISGRDGWKSTSKRYGVKSRLNEGYGGGRWEASLTQMEGLNIYGNESAGMEMRKRVMVVVDQSSHSRHAMMWALTHVTNKGDLLTLLHIVPACFESSSSTSLVSSLGSLCKACKQEVQIEALVVEGPKLATVMNQVKKLEVSVLVLGHKQPSPFIRCICGTCSTEEFVEQCIDAVDCLTIGVRKQRKGVGGYLISTRWQKNFWLLA